MNKIKKTTSILAFCVLVLGLMSPPLIAQKPNFKFKTINQADGLTNSTVQAMYEDSYGFIWLGTHHGVQRYDGKTFRNFTHNAPDSNGLSDNYINAFCEDANSDIWIATSHGLNKYIRKTDRIERYTIENKTLTRNGEPGFVGISRDLSDEDFLWITAQDFGLIKLNTQNDSIQIYSFLALDDKWLLWSLPYPGDQNKLLFGSENLYAIDKSTGEITELFHLEQNSDIPNNLINSAATDPTNPDILWLATGDYWGRGNQGGLIKYNLKSGETQFFNPETRKDDIPGRHFLQLCFQDNDNLWIGTRNNGVLLYKIKEDRFYNFKYNEYDEGSFVTENAVRSMLLDRSGTLWFGTWGDGISLLSPATQKFTHYKHMPLTMTGLPDNLVTAFAEDNNGNIWIGTKSGGLSEFNPTLKTFKNHFQEFATSGKNYTEITYLFFDSHDNLWIGTYGNALYRYTPATGVKIHFSKGSLKSEVSQKRISSIAEFRPGEILISTYGGGLNIYRYETNNFTQYIHNPADSNSIPDNQIWRPLLGDDGNYYFCGNANTVLFRFNPDTEQFQRLKTKNSFTTFQNPVKTSDGKIYVDDVSEGLSVLILSDEISFHTVYDNHGNSIKNIESVLLDADNNLWMGTGNGLIHYDPELNQIKRYDADDGLHGYEFSRHAGYRASTGEMYFGGKNGFSVFHPEKITSSNFNPPVVFTDFKLFQESLAIGEESPLKQNILLTDKLVLDHDQNDFSISFAALDYSNPHKIEYKYLLENHDEAWKDAGHNGVASYTNMDAGRYEFKVLATNSDGIWNSEEKVLEIIINPPWWLTTGAYIAYGVLFILGVFVVDRVQRRRLMERERSQTQEKELAQAKEIEKAYKTLKKTQSQLIHSEKMASLGELTAGIAHEIQNPLNFVNNFSDVSSELMAELDEEIEKDNQDEVKVIANDLRQNLDKIHHHGTRASSIVKGMLEHSRTRHGNMEPTDINAMADEYIRLAYHGIRAKNKSFNADFRADLDENVPKIKVVGQDIARVVLNLISNAFYAVSAKASTTIDSDYKPLVIVSTKMMDRNVEIRVQDNGDGIPENIIEKIFQPFFTTKAPGEGTGLGLSLSYDIITKGHGGKLEVVTKEGEGTEFIIHLIA